MYLRIYSHGFTICLFKILGMVKEVEKDGKVYFQCEDCKLLYDNREWTGKCESWCKKHHSCNIEITSHAVQED